MACEEALNWGKGFGRVHDVVSRGAVNVKIRVTRRDDVAPEIGQRTPAGHDLSDCGSTATMRPSSTSSSG